MGYELKTITTRNLTKLEKIGKAFCWHCREPLKLGDKVQHNKRAGRKKSRWFHDKPCFEDTWQ